MITLQRPSPRKIGTWMVTGSFGLLNLTDVARGHQTNAYFGDVGLTIGTTVMITAISGLLIGSIFVFIGRLQRGRVQKVLRRGLGPIFIMLGITYVVPAIDASITQSAIGIVGGCGGVWILSKYAHNRRNEVGAISVILIHRVVEGWILAAGYLAGSTVGIIGAFVIAIHASIESATVGGVAVNDGWLNAIAAVTLIQAGFISGALLGSATLYVNLSSLNSIFLAGGACTLCGLGFMDIRGHH